MSRILVVAAHPDDEVLGCGGTLARHATAGDDVHVLIVTEGATSRDDMRDPTGRGDEMRALRAAAAAAAHALSIQAPRFGGLPDNRLDSLPLLDVVKLVERVVAEVGPEIVYTHCGVDLNIDHQRVSQAVLTACRPQPGATVRRILAYETQSSTEWSASGVFRPTVYVDIAAYLPAKMRALQAYAAEMRAFPHARSLEAIEALARWRGASAGMMAAEAFELMRECQV